jgi:hypothetical protein
MMAAMHDPTYLHLQPGDIPPRLESLAPFKAVVVVEDEVTPQWQATVSEWLVHGGCRYMMAWGRKCSEWDDSVDLANLRLFNFEQIPDDEFVMTTWHENDSLHETFWFSERAAMHPSLNLERTYIIHISPNEREADLLRTFDAARKDKDGTGR